MPSSFQATHSAQWNPTENIWRIWAKLSSLMHRLSKNCNLSKSYTKHYIRVTTVTIVDQADFKSHMIMKVSGHRSEFSIKNYSHRNDRKTRCAMSETLGAAVSRYTDNNVHNAESVNHVDVVHSQVMLHMFQFQVAPRSLRCPVALWPLHCHSWKSHHSRSHSTKSPHGRLHL